MKKIYTTYDIAQLCNVDISTAINWIDSGKLQAYKTPGGHRRIRQENFFQFLRSYGLPIPRGLGEARFTALVIAEDPKVRAFVVEGLNEACPGIEFLEAGDGFTAGKLLAEKQPSLVIFDASLTGIDGRGACTLIKSDRRLQKARIIAVTAPGDAETRRLLLEAGADDCLPKPLTIPTLAESVKKIFP